jgi:hypothetical protein
LKEVRKQRTQRRYPPPPDSLWAAVGGLIGLILIIAATLLLTFTPEIAYQWFHRTGYARDQVEMLSPRRTRSITVRIVSTGQTLSVKSSTFGNISPAQRTPVWYNPGARTVWGIVLFDERIVSDEKYHGLPSGKRVAVYVALTLAFILSAIVLLRRAA